jgi:hypothetical protein
MAIQREKGEVTSFTEEYADVPLDSVDFSRFQMYNWVVNFPLEIYQLRYINKSYFYSAYSFLYCQNKLFNYYVMI